MKTRAAVALALVVLLCGADGPSGKLDIYFIDVMGGAATLIVTPDRESVLIDSGWSGFQDRDPDPDREGPQGAGEARPPRSPGHNPLARRPLRRRGWSRAGFRIDHFWDRGLPDPNAPDGDRANYPDGPFAGDALGENYRKASEGKRKALKAGDTLPLKGVEAVVLASGGKVIEGPSSPVNPLCDSAPADQPVDKSDNARSLTFRFRVGKFDFLDCGDLTWNVEKQLVCPVDRIGPIDLYQVTHHGMDISNHPTLIQTIAPTVAIMNNGPRKGGSAETVKRLRAVPSIQAAYQLHKNVATPADQNTDPALIANPNNSSGEFIHVAVEPDGSSYSVQVGANGQKREFKAS